MTGATLTLNAGSSSLKFALFRPDGGSLVRGAIAGIGTRPEVTATGLHGEALPVPDLPGSTHEDFLGTLLHWLGDHLDGGALAAVGHRIVHGGERFSDPVRIDDAVMAALEALVPLAPLHQPHNLSAIRAVSRVLPDLPQIGCFDTAFHGTMPSVARRLALPRDLAEAGVRRYGFHGLSYEFVSDHLRTLAPTLARGRVIVAHLGNGASLCALVDGVSVETTMGFSTLDGLVMGTRPGSLDPGAILYLLQARGMAAAEVEDLLYHRAGLLGVSGLSGDMRELAASPAPAAREAIELFAYRVAGEAGRLASAMGGFDGMVFTAGIGEHDAAIRAEICRRLGWLGVTLDAAANAEMVKAGGRISAGTSRGDVWVVPTDEEAMIARHTRAVMTTSAGATAAEAT